MVRKALSRAAIGALALSAVALVGYYLMPLAAALLLSGLLLFLL